MDDFQDFVDAHARCCIFFDEGFFEEFPYRELQLVARNDLPGGRNREIIIDAYHSGFGKYIAGNQAEDSAFAERHFGPSG